MSDFSDASDSDSDINLILHRLTCNAACDPQYVQPTLHSAPAQICRQMRACNSHAGIVIAAASVHVHHMICSALQHMCTVLCILVILNPDYGASGINT